jgi:predicted RNA-binding Zn ribbon-like protein
VTGRPRRVTPDEIRRMVARRISGATYREIATEFGVSHTYAYRLVDFHSESVRPCRHCGPVTLRRGRPVCGCETWCGLADCGAATPAPV